MTLPPGPALAGTYPDPSIEQVDGTYWLVASTFEYFPALPLFRSGDLLHWQQVGHAIDRLDQIDLASVLSSRGLYAPTLRHHDGTWYLICTLVRDGGPADGPEGCFVLTTDDPSGAWSDPIWLSDIGGIDPSLFFDGGRVWLTGTRLAAEPLWPSQTEVFLQELDAASLAPVGDEHVLWHGAVEGAVWAEGPHLYRSGDWYYLLASEGGTEFHHALSVARSRRIEGPYEGSRSNPVLTHRTLGSGHPVQNVGHADLVEGPEGSWAAVLLATRPVGGHALLGRETFAVDVVWEDEWPVFAPGVGQVLAASDSAEESVMPDELAWTQVRTARDVGAVVDVAAGTIALPPHPHPLAEVGTPAFLGVRLRHHDARLSATVPAADGAGLVARQSEAAFLAALREGDRVVVTRGDERLGDLPAGETIGLGIRGTTAIVESGGERIELDARFLSSRSAGGFVGVWLGVAALGDTDVNDDTPLPVVFRDVQYGGR